MKLKVKDIILLNTALLVSSQIKDLDPKLGYAIARNINRLKSLINDFSTAEAHRVEFYCIKNEDGSPKMNERGVYDFGDKRKEALDKYNEIENEEVEFDPYTIERCDSTDKLPALAQAELLDIIIK